MKAKPSVAYLTSAILVWLFYIGWFAFFVMPHTAPTRPPDLKFAIGFAVFFCLAGGFVPALALMSLPWIAVLWASRRLQSSGPLYFGASGAVLLFVIGCTTASLSPKPFFIEDQTFFEGAIIAAQREGMTLLIAGGIFGFIYWLVGDRNDRKLTHNA